MSRILVISPHPDDESVGCGGTLRRHVVHGDEVRVIFLTSGENGGHGKPPAETARIREAEAKAAAEILGIGEIQFWRETDGSVRVTEDIANRLVGVLREWRPDTIYSPHNDEAHPDHRAAARLVARALAELPAGSNECSLLMYEVWTPLQEMSAIIDITPYMDDKLAAIRAYRSQCDVLRFDEAMSGLARYRGEMHSWPGGPYAEIFLTGKTGEK